MLLRDTLSCLSPVAKRLLPRPLPRLLLLHVLGVNRRYGRLLEAPSRLCMEREILPWLAARCRRVLFVGAAPYTHHYERLFRPGQYTTIDVHSSTAVWGSRDHIVGPIQDINRRRPKGSFDCIVLIGVFGFGVDKIEDMSVVLKGLHDALEPQGFLVVGWNTDLHDDPETVGPYQPLFVRNLEAPWTERRRFPAETHVYDFNRRRPD